MAKVKLTSLYVRDKDGQESSVNIAESKEGLTSAVAGLQNKVQLIDAKLKNSKGKQTIAHSIGEIIKSKTPIDSFGFKELKGEYISEYSDYTDFYRYIERLYNASEDDIRYKITKNFREYYNQNKNNYVMVDSNVDENGIYHGKVHSPIIVTDEAQKGKFAYTNTFELHLKFKTSSTLTSARQCLIDSNQSVTSHNCYIAIHNDALLYVSCRDVYNSETLIFKDKKTSFRMKADTNYRIKLKFTGSQYLLWVQEENNDPALAWTVNSTVHCGKNGVGIFSEFGGYSWGANDPWLGEIDLNECYFIADEKETWRAFEKKEIHSKKGFLTEEEYNDCLALSGQCNGIVYDNENRRVRLPTLASRELVESKKPTESDPSWFNLYSDGWIEQGSEVVYNVNRDSHYNAIIVKFPVSFKDECYQVLFSDVRYTGTGVNTVNNTPYIRERMKDQMMIDVRVDTTVHSYNYRAYGYSDRHLNQTNYYYICIANGVDHLVIDKNTQSQLNIPFTLLEEKISYFKLNNSSWLLSEGQFNSGNAYKSVYNFLVEALNSENSEISVKDVNSEYSDYDFVVDTVKREFRLPKKSKQVDSQVDFLNTVKQSATDNARFIVEKKDPTDSDRSWYVLYNDGWCEQGANNLAIAGNSTSFLVNLVRPYTNNNYNVTIRISDNENSDSTGAEQASEWGCGQKTSSNFKIGINGGYSTQQFFDWSAKGYTDQTTESTLEIGEYQSPLHLYYYVGETNINYGLVDVGHLTEEVTNARSELNYYSKLLNEIEKKSDQYSYDLAVKNNTKALVNVDYSKLYSEHMNKLFAMPDPDNTGTIIKLRTNVTKENVQAFWQDGGISLSNNDIANSLQSSNAKSHGAGSYTPMTLIDEFGRTLYLIRIAYAHDYVECSYGSNIHYLGNCHRAHLTNRNANGNYTFDLYFSYDKSKANYGSVVALNEDQIPTYDVKAKMYCDIAQFDGRMCGGLHVNSYNWTGSYVNDDVASCDYTTITMEPVGYNRTLGAVQNLFNIVSSGAWAYALNNVTITFLNTRIKKCSFGVIRNIGLRKSYYSYNYPTNNSGIYDWYSPQVSNYDFSIETKYGVVSKHYDQTQFTDLENFNVVLDLSEATNKARNLNSRTAEYNELLDVKNTLNTKIDNSVQTINNTINTKYNDLSTQIQTVQTNLNTANSNLQTQITNNKTDVNNKYTELKDLYTKTTKVKVISKEIEEQLELGTEKYDEDTLYLVDPTYDNEKAVWDAKQAVLTDQYNRAVN